MKLKIKAVFFDAGETLIFRNPSLAQITKGYLDKAGHKISLERLEKVLTDRAKDMKKIVEAGRMNDSQKWVVYMDSVFRTLNIKDRELNAIIRERLKNGTSFRVYPHTVETVKKLKKQGYKTGIISNAPKQLFSILKRCKIDNLFNPIVVSEDVGFEKPSPKIFKEALKRAKVHPNEAVYVGDNLIADIHGALKAGIYPIWVTRNTKNAQFTFRDAKPPEGVPVIRHIGELPEVLRGL